MNAGRTRVTPGLPLRLSAAEKGNKLEVSWDRTTAAIGRAKRGVLSISDGPNKKDVELSETQLRTGTVLYSWLSSEVAFKLEVFTKGRESVSESIRVMFPESPSKSAPTMEPGPDTAAAVEKLDEVRSRPMDRIPISPGLKSRAKSTAPNEPAPQDRSDIELQRPAMRR